MPKESNKFTARTAQDTTSKTNASSPLLFFISGILFATAGIAIFLYRNLRNTENQEIQTETLKPIQESQTEKSVSTQETQTQPLISRSIEMQTTAISPTNDTVIEPTEKQQQPFSNIQQLPASHNGERQFDSPNSIFSNLPSHRASSENLDNHGAPQTPPNSDNNITAEEQKIRGTRLFDSAVAPNDPSPSPKTNNWLSSLPWPFSNK